MFACRICHFAVELDDVVLRHAGGRCVCLACYLRVVGAPRPMAKSLRRALIAVLADEERRPA